jgi:pyridoxine 4-dehydrogenase
MTIGQLAGHTVNRIGFGAGQLAHLRDDRPAAVAVVRRAVELGVDHIDTAEFYGFGFVNDVLRQALDPSDGVMIVSKVGAVPDPGGPFPMRLAQRPAELRAAVESNLATLGLERIPVVNLRRLDAGLAAISASGDQVVAVEDQLAEMIALRDAGKIGAIGLSSVSVDVLRRALPAGIACVQNEHSLVARDDAALGLCVAEGIAWVPYHPLGGNLPGLKRVTSLPEVIAAAEQAGCTPAQIGLAWLLHQSPNTLLIPGTSKVAHLDANMAVADVQLPAGFIASPQ